MTSAVARLILDETGPLAGRVLVVDDVDGELTSAALGAGCQVRTWCDDVRAEASIPAAHRTPLLTGAGADIVLWRLPRALSAVDDIAQRLADGASPNLRVVAGARVKHMTRAQNDELARHFSSVRASLGRDKSRVIHAGGPLAAEPRWPIRRFEPELGLHVVSRGTVFNTNRLDAGTRLLLNALDAHRPDPGRRALDWGSGSGIIASFLARAGFEVTATDVSADAVESTALTAAANDLRVTALRLDGLTGLDAASVDLLVTNPPFHVGAAKDSTPTLDMFEQASEVLAPGGELWAVWNSHLPYLPRLRAIGPTRLVARDRSFTVSRTIRR
jgi:16S rRNA (guanine1207-N2)-methyltransferase